MWSAFTKSPVTLSIGSLLHEKNCNSLFLEVRLDKIVPILYFIIFVYLYFSLSHAMCCTHLQHRVGELHNEAAPIKFSSFTITLEHYGAAICNERFETIRCEPNESEILTKQTHSHNKWPALIENSCMQDSTNVGSPSRTHEQVIDRVSHSKFFKVFVPLPLLQCCLWHIYFFLDTLNTCILMVTRILRQGVCLCVGLKN